MADKKYYIRVPEARVEVSEEVYKAFWSMERHSRTLQGHRRYAGLGAVPG